MGFIAKSHLLIQTDYSDPALEVIYVFLRITEVLTHNVSCILHS